MMSLSARLTSRSISSLLYFSKYSLIVVPDDPVPDCLNTNLDPSLYLKIQPQLSLTLPSTGSTYLKISADLPSAVNDNILSLIFTNTFLANSVSIFSQSYRQQQLRPQVAQWFFTIYSTDQPVSAKMLSQHKTAQRPSFSLMWSLPVPNDSSPQI